MKISETEQDDYFKVLIEQTILLNNHNKNQLQLFVVYRRWSNGQLYRPAANVEGFVLWQIPGRDELIQVCSQAEDAKCRQRGSVRVAPQRRQQSRQRTVEDLFF